MAEPNRPLYRAYLLAATGVDCGERTLRIVVPITIASIFLLLYMNFRSVAESRIVMLSLPFALVGSFALLWILDYNLSVAARVGIIALAGVAGETAVVMLVFLDHAWEARSRAGRKTREDLHAAILEGAADRVRPLLMTVAATSRRLRRFAAPSRCPARRPDR